MMIIHKRNRIEVILKMIEIINDIQNNLDILNYYFGSGLTKTDYDKLDMIYQTVFTMVMEQNCNNMVKW